MAYADVILADSPTLYWRLGESSGTTAEDATANNRDGTYRNTPTLGVTGLIEGVDTAVDFARTSSEDVTLADEAALDGTATVTLEVWVRADSQPATGAFHTIIAKTPSAEESTYGMDYRNSSGTMQVTFAITAGGTFTERVVAFTLTTGVRHHVVARYNGSNMSIWVDGVAIGGAATSKTGTVEAGVDQLTVGSYNGVDYWDGVIDEFALYAAATALTDAQIVGHAVEGYGGPIYVGAGTYTSGTGAIAPPAPTNHVQGDVELLYVESANQAISLSTANGFAELPDSGQGTGTAAADAATRLAVFWRRWDGSAGSPTVADSGDHTSGIILAFRGCPGSGDPWDVTSAGTEATSDTTGSFTGDTTTVDRALVVVGATSHPDVATARFSAWTNAELEKVEERTDNSQSASGTGGGIGTATGRKLVAGAFGATTVTYATTSVKAFHTVTLKPVSTTQNLQRGTSDTAAATDAVTRAVTAARSTSDTGAAADALARTVAASRSAADSAPSSDALARLHAHSRATTDSAPATDSPGRAVSSVRAAADTAQATDTAARTVAAARGGADAAQASDSLAAVDGRARETTDSAPASDVLARSSASSRSVADSAGTSDAVTRQQQHGRAVSDSAGAADAATRAWTGLRTIGDSAPVSDAVSKQGSGAASTSDSAPATDAVTRAAAASRSAADSAPASDSVARRADASRAVSDAAATSDSVTRAAGTSRGTSDVASALDALVGSYARDRATSDTAVAADAAARAMVLSRSTADGSVTLDALGRLWTGSRAVTDVASAADMLSADRFQLSTAIRGRSVGTSGYVPRVGSPSVGGAGTSGDLPVVTATRARVAP